MVESTSCFPVWGVHSVVGQDHPVVGQIPGRHHDRTHPEIHIQDFLRFSVQHIVAFQQVGDGSVPGPSLFLRTVHRFIESDPGIPAQGPDQLQEGLVGIRRLDAASRHDGPRIDHRVEGAPVFQLQLEDAVEPVPGGFHADLAEYLVVAGSLEGQDQGKCLGDALHGKGNVIIPGTVHTAVFAHETDSQIPRVGLGQFRDVTGYLTFVQHIPSFRQCFFQYCLDLFLVHDHAFIPLGASIVRCIIV